MNEIVAVIDDELDILEFVYEQRLNQMEIDIDKVCIVHNFNCLISTRGKIFENNICNRKDEQRY